MKTRGDVGTPDLFDGALGRTDGRRRGAVHQRQPALSGAAQQLEDCIDKLRRAAFTTTVVGDAVRVSKWGRERVFSLHDLPALEAFVAGGLSNQGRP